MKLLRVLLFVTALAACAPRMATPQPTTPPETALNDDGQMRKALEDLKERKAALVAPRAHSDCRAICQLADLVCEASERICVIASRHSGDTACADHCRGARGDCESAQHECDQCS